MSKTVYISTGNSHKFAELSFFAQKVFPQHQIFMQPVEGLEETGTTFVGNARLKAEALMKQLKQSGKSDFYVLGDDSGLCVEGLDGSPGIYSSRYSGEGATDSSNVQKLLGALEPYPQGHANRRAHFVCALILQKDGGDTAQDSQEFVAEGKMHGAIATSVSGQGGFGYDPVFVPQGQTKSLAEYPEAQKNQISHRYHAFANLKDLLGGELS